MTHVWSTALAAAMFIAGGALARPAAGVQEPPSFRVGVELISLSVTVTDGTHRYVSNLDHGDFVVLEAGVPQEVTFFRRTDVPLGIALLLDTSASMQDAMPIAQQAAVDFLRELAPGDVATVVDFDSRVRVAAEFTSDILMLEQAIRDTTAGGSTALFNAVYIALRELARIRLEDEREGPRRRAIVVLSDGEDTSSLLTFDEVLDAAARSDAVIYTIGLGMSPMPNRRAQDPTFVLRRLAQQTGGRTFLAPAARDLPAIYRDIRAELSSQYLLAYESSAPRDGRWRPISVRVLRPGHTARAKQGYYAPSR